MAVKSVIEVDVKDGAFKAFAALYAQYDKLLKSSPKAWANVNQRVTGTRKSFEDLVATQVASIVQQRLMNESLREAERLTTSSSERWARATRTVANNWKSISRSAAATTASVVRWGAFTSALGLLGGAAGLFGMERLGESVSARRRAAGGLGITYGQEQAFGLNFRRFADPDQLLGGVAGAKADVTSRGYAGLIAAGVGTGGNAAETSAALLKRIPHLFGGTPEGLIAPKLQALGLDQFLSASDVRRYLAASPEERAKQEGAFRSDTGSLGLSQEQQRAWNDFTTQLERAGKKIETVFVVGLSPLTGPLEHLSQSFADLVENLLKSPQLKEWIGAFASGMEDFSKTIGTPEFKQGVETFAQGVIALGKLLVDIVGWFGGKGSAPPTVPAEKEGHDTWNAMVRGSREKRKAVSDFFAPAVKSYVETHSQDFEFQKNPALASALRKSTPYSEAFERATGVRITIDNRTGGDVAAAAETAAVPAPGR